MKREAMTTGFIKKSNYNSDIFTLFCAQIVVVK